MQFHNAVLLSIATLLTSSFAKDIVIVIKEDIKANAEQYSSFIQANSAELAPLISLYKEAETYTDDSYTTLLDDQELTSIIDFATALPWFSSRIEPKVDDATPAITSAIPSATKSSDDSKSDDSKSSKTDDKDSKTDDSHSTSTDSKTDDSKTSKSSAGAAVYVAPSAGLAFALAVAALL